MATFGYARVSDVHQNEDRQMIAMSEQGIPPDCVFVDKISGKDFERPSYKALLENLKSGDLLYVKSIDRLGRHYGEIIENWRIITKEKQADIVVIDMPLLDTRRGKDLLGTLIADIVLNLLSFVAQNERENIRQRQSEGIAAAKARGVRFGRPIKKPPEDFGNLVKLWERGYMPLSALLEQTGLKIATFYRRLRELRATKQKVNYQKASRKPCDSNETEGTGEGMGARGVSPACNEKSGQNARVPGKVGLPIGRQQGFTKSTIKKSSDGFGFSGEPTEARQGKIADAFNTDMLDNRSVLRAFA